MTLRKNCPVSGVGGRSHHPAPAWRSSPAERENQAALEWSSFRHSERSILSLELLRYGASNLGGKAGGPRVHMPARSRQDWRAGGRRKHPVPTIGTDGQRSNIL